jgi:hypothetical protein
LAPEVLKVHRGAVDMSAEANWKGAVFWIFDAPMIEKPFQVE